MATVELNYLSIFRDRKRRKMAFYRRDGVRTRLRDAAGKPVDPDDQVALLDAYKAVHQAHEAANSAAEQAAGDRTVRPRSVADLIQTYRKSPEWEEKAPATKRDYEKALKPLEDDFGRNLVIGLARPHVKAIRDRYAWRMEKDQADPQKQIRVPNARQANRVITMLSILLTYAVDLGWRQDNPALRPKRLRAKGDDYRPWTEDEFVQFMERSDAEWQFNALFALLTAQRGQDQVEVKWSDYDGVSIYVVQQKGRKTVKLWIEAHPVLKAAMDARKAARAGQNPVPLTVICRADGTKWKTNAFQKAAGAAIRAAGLEGPVWHGLRATASGWVMDGEGTTKMLQALTGHQTEGMAAKYARGANQRKLAAKAVAAISVPKWGQG